MDYDALVLEKEITKVFNLQMNNKQKLRESTAKDRIEKLKKLNNCILNHKTDIINAMYDDFRKPEEEVLMTEIYPVASEIRHTIKSLHKWMKDKKIKTPISFFGTKCRIRHEPYGISLIMSPWNFPFLLTLDPLVSAIAAGNCVIVKPSELSPASSACIKKMLSEIFSEDEVAVFEGDDKVCEALLEKPFDNIFFTGSPSKGKMVMSAASKNLTNVTLELGGKSPVIIDRSADLDIAARRIAWGKCLNAGQICVAPDYLFIPEGKKEEFIKFYIKYTTQYYGNINNAKNMKYCRIINKNHYNRIKELVDEAVSKGAKINFGGFYDETDNYISPTILTDIPTDCKILEEEIFGPVLPIITYNNIDDVVKYVNSKPKPLALYIFSQDNNVTNSLLKKIDSGDTVINDVVLHVANVKMPFGGVSNSGLGKTHGYEGFRAFTHERSYLKQAKKSTMTLCYPPFTKATNYIIEMLIKYF
ncbi:aldehyde dehydrogenase family protein [Clostridium sp. WILCCON 0269]|uniref:Aldehyde dehydrogenase n=1 Tax=Candidatus Clostridium eludens TaxID=3381663 RepID=A0ABW8STY1_9CLOT